MTPRRGDVFWYETGSGRRPGLVMTRDTVIPLLNSMVVIPATRTIRGIAAEVRLDRSDGMPHACALTCDNLGVIEKSELRGRITHLDDARMEEVCEALSYALGC